MTKLNLHNLDNKYLIAGLGNPGEKYEKTRHNAGFFFLDLLAEKLKEKWTDNEKLGCQLIKNGNLILIKPYTYMNNSGRALEAVMDYYKMLEKKMFIKVKNSDLSDKLLVVHDELDIDFGKYKFSIDSRSAGNNGVQSIIDHLKTKNFRRLRLGVKSNLLQHVPAKEFVLQRFNKEERDVLSNLSAKIIDENFEL